MDDVPLVDFQSVLVAADHVIGVGPSSLTDLAGPPQEGVLPIVLLPILLLLRLGLEQFRLGS